MDELAKLGVLPTDAYYLTVDEASRFITNRSTHEAELSISSAWRTINFLGAFLNEKLRNLDHYLPETPKRKAKKEEKKKKLEDKLSKIL